MIFRLSQKLSTKLHSGTLPAMPLDTNPLADWSGHLFVADRTQYILVTNTVALYSIVLSGKGITNVSHFTDQVLRYLAEFLADDSQHTVYRKFIAPASESVHLAKALNRSVTGSMNDMIFHAKMMLIEDRISAYEMGFKLNEIPFSSLKYANPKETFKAMQVPKKSKSSDAD